MEKPQTKYAPKANDDNKYRLCHKSKKPCPKENTRPIEIKLNTEQRAIKRAMFNYSVATKLYVIELRKKMEEKLQKMIEEDEIRLLRKEMTPRAQLMPYFDRPFCPQRSNRPLTIPRQPSFHAINGKCQKCVCCHGLCGFEQRQAVKHIK